MIRIHGECGSGKSAALHALEAAPPVGWRAVYVPIPTLDFPGIASWCLEQLGEPPSAEPIAALRASAREARVILLVDDAELLPLDTALALRAFEHEPASGVAIVAACDRAERLSPALVALGSPAREIEVELAGAERASREIRAQLEVRPLRAPASASAPPLAPASPPPLPPEPAPPRAPVPAPEAARAPASPPAPAPEPARAASPVPAPEPVRTPVPVPPPAASERVGSAVVLKTPPANAQPQARPSAPPPAPMPRVAPPPPPVARAPLAPGPPAATPRMITAPPPRASPRRPTAVELRAAADTARAGSPLGAPAGAAGAASEPVVPAETPSAGPPPRGPRSVPLWLAVSIALTAFVLPIAFFGGFWLGKSLPEPLPASAAAPATELPPVAAAPPEAPPAPREARAVRNPRGAEPAPSAPAPEIASSALPEDPAAEDAGGLDVVRETIAAIDALLGESPAPPTAEGPPLAETSPTPPVEPAPASTTRPRSEGPAAEAPPASDWDAPTLVSVAPPSEGR